MKESIYSQPLGMITEKQFQAALDRFDAGRFLKAEAIPFGTFGQNIFVSSSTGEYVLRGAPHFWWQFPTEQFFTRQLHERTHVPVPWPYLIDPTTDIFGWSFVLMPRMPGLQLANPEAKKQIEMADKLLIAQALGENLAQMQKVTWPIAGRYNPAIGTIEPFKRAQELAWPFSPSSDDEMASRPAKIITYSESVKERLRHGLIEAQAYNGATTTSEDIRWVEQCIAEAQDALDEPFEPCLLMQDYKEGNLVVASHDGRWQVSGVFDLMEAHFGDGEADLARPLAEYLDEAPQLARAFFAGYQQHRVLRPHFVKRFPIYLLLDRAILWNFFQHQGWCWWPEQWTFREWASHYLSPALHLFKSMAGERERA